ncbi:BTB domain-containing protein [Mycena sanguinolenta]|uniref:BTB domain-containing protein n=1 Tax=Mycena sanguinolenta TaxID=230812 RepID=A0A8H6YG39_9AGAR|nr:BTB domain-containing protein [Mycena sanguinolenta]
MSDVPPTKRRRTDDPDDVAAEETPLVRSTEYWFDEGNVILQVESTQFRLPKSMLSMHSNVFRDMFMMPLPADEPTVEGCPVVVLTGDTVEDWTHLLGAIFPKCLMKVPSFAIIAAVLRLSKKYDFPEFRKDCLHRLRKEFPATLEEFDNGTDSWSHIRQENIYISPSLPWLTKSASIRFFHCSIA